MTRVSTIRAYVAVAAALLILLAATSLVARLDLGAMNVLIALVIAAVKAGLVATFFMHLRTSSPLMRIFAGTGLLWLGIMMALSLNDYLTRS
ncbi:MAG: cytochrome C oxidase subunit IV family protein [Phycisphaerales bacterium]|nr:cytochrome C oxidase subunit IV family protein [Phycisphaerales bacterium]